MIIIILLLQSIQTIITAKYHWPTKSFQSFVWAVKLAWIDLKAIKELWKEALLKCHSNGTPRHIQEFKIWVNTPTNLIIGIYPEVSNIQISTLVFHYGFEKSLELPREKCCIVLKIEPRYYSTKGFIKIVQIILLYIDSFFFQIE